MSSTKNSHSVCAWSLGDGKGRFVPATRDAFSSMPTADKIRLYAEKLRGRVPENVELGFEMHHPSEFSTSSAAEIADALSDSGIYLAMTTPGLHSLFGYGGPASLDPKERDAANEVSRRTVDLTYGPLRKAWHPEAGMEPTLVLWNGSWGYHIHGAQKEMRKNLATSLASLCGYVNAGRDVKDRLYVGIEPKGSEGHPAMLIKNVASAINFWERLNADYGVDLSRRGVNCETGHGGMFNDDQVDDTLQQLEHKMMVHSHKNSQGNNDSVRIGGPGLYDIDHGVSINWPTILDARFMRDGGYHRWIGHDMQPRPEDNEDAAVERVRRSILAWEACDRVGQMIPYDKMIEMFRERNTIGVEEVAREAVIEANRIYGNMLID